MKYYFFLFARESLVGVGTVPPPTPIPYPYLFKPKLGHPYSIAHAVKNKKKISGLVPVGYYGKEQDG